MSHEPLKAKKNEISFQIWFMPTISYCRPHHTAKVWVKTVNLRHRPFHSIGE